MNIVYTIGHTNYSINQFVDILNLYSINCIIDVRSTPYSKYTPQFNSKELKEELKKLGILYIHMGEEFGARRAERKFYPHGYLDFEKVRLESDLFHKGIHRVEVGCQKGYRIALMCTEKMPIDCHRCILVGKGLKDHGFQIRHVVSKEISMTQEEIETQLLDRYYPQRNQISLDTLMQQPESESELILECYRKRNKEIGYIVEEE